jgi:hypothetical protein
MDTLLSEKIVTARNNYACDACYWWLQSGLTADDLHSDDQRLILEAAEADKWMILKGQQYLRQTGVQDCQMTTYRARIGMNSVCTELDLFPDH